MKRDCPNGRGSILGAVPDWNSSWGSVEGTAMIDSTLQSYHIRMLRSLYRIANCTLAVPIGPMAPIAAGNRYLCMAYTHANSGLNRKKKSQVGRKSECRKQLVKNIRLCVDDVWRSRLQRFPMGSSNRQLPSNIAKAYTCAEENTGNPSPEGNAFLCDPCYQSICFSGTVQTGECCRTLSRRGH